MTVILRKVRFAFSFTIEEEDQQRAKTQFSIDTHPPFELALASIFCSWIPNFCVCALIQYFSPFFCLCALIQPHHCCTAVQSTRPPGTYALA
ncbi:hypothetical protein ACSBR1_012854 [Camellia fascicularis]